MNTEVTDWFIRTLKMLKLSFSFAARSGLRPRDHAKHHKRIFFGRDKTLLVRLDHRPQFYKKWRTKHDAPGNTIGLHLDNSSHFLEFWMDVYRTPGRVGPFDWFIHSRSDLRFFFTAALKRLIENAPRSAPRPKWVLVPIIYNNCNPLRKLC